MVVRWFRLIFVMDWRARGGYVVGAEEITGDGSACRRVVVEDTGRESTEKKEGRPSFDVRRCTIKLYTKINLKADNSGPPKITYIHDPP